MTSHQPSAISRRQRTKTCCACGQPLPLAAFYPDAGGRFGVKGSCRDCYNAARRRRYAAAGDASAAAARARYWADPDRYRGYVRRWRERNRDRKRAMDRAYTARRRATRQAQEAA